MTTLAYIIGALVAIIIVLVLLIAGANYAANQLLGGLTMGATNAKKKTRK